jgi:hypothetical protein
MSFQDSASISSLDTTIATAEGEEKCEKEKRNSGTVKEERGAIEPRDPRKEG